jgi:hypothetical protein
LRQDRSLYAIRGNRRSAGNARAFDEFAPVYGLPIGAV